jgi:hypothetical protein
LAASTVAAQLADSGNAILRIFHLGEVEIVCLWNQLQYDLQIADKRQGTTSVVPKMAQTESGFSRCGIASN